MTSIQCLALIIFMESRGESTFTQSLVADVVIARAAKENLSICESMKKPKSYSWMWDGVNTKVDKTTLKQLEKIAKQEITRSKARTRLFFSNCTAGKRFKTGNTVIKSGKLCFY